MPDIGMDTAGDVFMLICGFFIVCGIADKINSRNRNI